MSVSNLQKAAYAIWTYGRTTNPNEAAAVMLYVHSLMGDARPGELDPAALNPSVVDLHAVVLRNSARYHGPYRVVVTLPAGIGAGKTGTGQVRVISGAGIAVPNVELSLSVDRRRRAVDRKTNANGVATVALRATSADGVRLKATTEPLPATLPTIYTADHRAGGAERPAARGGGRAAGAGDDEAAGSKAQISMTSDRRSGCRRRRRRPERRQGDDRGSAPELPRQDLGAPVRPFRTVAAISCTGTPVSESSFTANGPGSYKTPSRRR